MGEKIKRKSIDLPASIVKKLESLGKADGRLVKNYMEKVLIDHVKGVEEKKSECQSTN